MEGNAWKQKAIWKYPIDKYDKKLIDKKHRLWTKFQKSRDKRIEAEYKNVQNFARKSSRNVANKFELDIATASKLIQNVFSSM